MKKVLGSIIVSVLAGCVQIPTTKLDYGDLHMRLPKDDTAASLLITVSTNHTLTIKATKISAANNPEVINSSAQGQVDIIKATGEVAANVAGTVVKAAK